MDATIRGVLWNLLLAFIPVVLGYLIWWAFGGKSRKRPIHWIFGLILIVAWLVFLPNTCYLFTEWRHLLEWLAGHEVLTPGLPPTKRLELSAHMLLFFFLYSGAGLLLFVFALRPVERRTRVAGIHPILYFPFLFVLVSLGVYLGLVIRLNSWDVLKRPAEVWQNVSNAVAAPNVVYYILVFALFLWIMYELADIWVDGMADRLKQIT